jgi:hypothetical protein
VTFIYVFVVNNFFYSTLKNNTISENKAPGRISHLHKKSPGNARNVILAFSLPEPGKCLKEIFYGTYENIFAMGGAM